MEEFQVGDQVWKVEGYQFVGEVRAVFTNRKGETRLVVELISQGNGNGMLHIYSPSQMRKLSKPKLI